MASPRTWIRTRAIRALAPARLRAYHKLQGPIDVSPGERTALGRRSRSAARQTTVCRMLVRTCRATSPRAGQVPDGKVAVRIRRRRFGRAGARLRVRGGA